MILVSPQSQLDFGFFTSLSLELGLGLGGQGLGLGFDNKCLPGHSMFPIVQWSVAGDDVFVGTRGAGRTESPQGRGV